MLNPSSIHWHRRWPVILRSVFRDEGSHPRRLATRPPPPCALSVSALSSPDSFAAPHNLNNSRNRRVCCRDTGICDCFLSSIFSMKLDLNHGTTSLM
jgi:hypothetical protein